MIFTATAHACRTGQNPSLTTLLPRVRCFERQVSTWLTSSRVVRTPLTAPVPLVPVGATSRDYDNPLATCPLEDRWPWCAAPVRVAVARPREPLRLAASAPAATSCQGRLATAALRARALDIRYLFLVPQSGFLTLATRWTLATWSGCQAQHRRRRRLTLYFHSHRQGTQGTLALAPNVLARCFGVCMLRGADAGGEYVVLREIVKGFCEGLFQVYYDWCSVIPGDVLCRARRLWWFPRPPPDRVLFPMRYYERGTSPLCEPWLSKSRTATWR